MNRSLHSYLTSVLVLSAFALLAPPADAQTYTRQTATYNWISTATHTVISSWDGSLGCVDAAGDDSLSPLLDIGFPFQFGATTYTQLRVMSNGRLQFNNTYCNYGTASTGPPRTYPDSYPSGSLDNTMKIYGADIDTSSVGGGTITYATVGTAPNRMFVVTWNNVQQWSAATSSYNLQIQLSEDGTFYFIYGTSADTVEGPAEIGWQLNSSNYSVVQQGLPANNTAWRFVRPGATGFRISHASTGLYCLDDTVTVTTVDAGGNATKGYTGTVNLTTTTGRGTWLLSSGSGTLTDAVPDDGAAAYAWNSNESSATFLLRYRSGPATVTVHSVDSITPGIADDNTQGSITFAPSGFTVTSSPFANPAGGVPAFASPQTAGAGFPLYITAYGQNPTDATCGIITGYTGAKTLKFWSTYANPSTGTVQASINGMAIATAEAASAAQAVSFASGQASVTALYRDAGSLSLSMKDDTTGNPGLPTGIRGSTGSFVSRPASFVVSNIRRTSDGFANPGAATATGTVFIGAGRPFTATVTAVDAAGNVTPNFGRETPAETVGFAVSLVLPAGGHAPAVNGTAGTFSSGIATGTAFSWPEVGIVNLVPRVADGDYLGAGAVTGTATGNVGRFVPDSFGVSLNTPVLGTGCLAGGFSYVGQPLTYTVAPVLTATALAFGGAIAQNYTGSLLRLTNASLTGRTYAAASGTFDTSGLPATTSDPVIVDTGGGVATLTFSAGSGLAFNRGAATPPFAASITLAINVLDLDGAAGPNPVTFGSGTGIAFSAGTTQRFGRLRLRTAVGSELLDLPMRLTTEYYVDATQGFTTNTDDSCTTAPSISFSNYQAQLNAGETCVRDSGSPGSSSAGCATPATAGLRFRTTPLAGDFNLTLAAPGAGNSGALTVTATAPAWLRYDWNTAAPGLENPFALGTFGLFPGPASRIYQREVY